MTAKATIPVSIRDLTPEWLASVLRRPFDEIDVERIGERYGFASQMYRVVGGEMSCIVKLSSVDVGASEIEFYRTFGDDAGLRVPRPLHTGSDSTRVVVILEDLSEARQGDVLVVEPVGDLEALARRLGGLHGRWWGDVALGRLTWLRDGRRQARTADWLRQRGDEIRERFGGRLSPLATALIPRAGELLEMGNRLLADAPPTLVHGDLHLDNVLFDGGDPIVLDWAGCRRGPGVQDVVPVLFQMAEPPSADRLIRSYLLALARSGVEIDRFRWDAWLGGAVAWAFVFWTLGTVRWSPADERGVAIQLQTIDDAVAMVEFWASRHPGFFD